MTTNIITPSKVVKPFVNPYSEGNEKESLKAMRPGRWYTALQVSNIANLKYALVINSLENLSITGDVEQDRQGGKIFYRRVR